MSAGTWGVIAFETPASGARNGLPWKPYRYRGAGTDVLTAFMDDEPGEGLTVTEDRLSCGTERAYAQHRRHGEPIDAACRAADTRASLGRRRRRRERYAEARDAGLSRTEAQFVRDSAMRCPGCGYLPTAPGHKLACEGTA